MIMSPEILEAVVLSCLESNPISFRRVDELEVKRVRAAIRRATVVEGASLRYTATRNVFLSACLDMTDKAEEEYLVVGYGLRSGSTTHIEKVEHIVGERCRVTIPDRVSREIQRHHFHRSDAEVVVFHNHPRTGGEPVWFHTVKSLIQDIPIASGADRRQLEIHAFNPVGLARQLVGQGCVRFFLGESGYVKEFRVPRLLPWLDKMVTSGPHTSERVGAA